MSKVESAPIQGWFVNRTVPMGSAPEEIKRQWVDIPLPLRQLSAEEDHMLRIGHAFGNLLDVRVIDDAVDVYVFDGVKALALFGRKEAADFWGEVLLSDQSLIFRASEGQLYTPGQMQRIIPGIEIFDYL